MRHYLSHGVLNFLHHQEILIYYDWTFMIYDENREFEYYVEYSISVYDFKFKEVIT